MRRKRDPNRKRMVCKECGASDQFYEAGSVFATRNLDVYVAEDGSPDVVEDLHVESDDWEFEADHIVCGKCDAESTKIADLVVSEDAAGQMCQCGHPKRHHRELPYDAKRYSRGLAPCDECRCDDFTPEPVVEIHPAQLTIEEAA